MNHDINLIRTACIKSQPKARRLNESICFHDVLLVLGMMPSRVQFNTLGTDMEMVIFDEMAGMYQRATWDMLHDDIAQQTDECVSFIARVIESYRAPPVRDPSPEALAALQ